MEHVPTVLLRAGQLSIGWQLAMGALWTAVFFGFAATWKTSQELGIGTWWLGPRSDPQPTLIRMLPFAIAVVVAMCAVYNVRRVPSISVGGSLLVAAIAVPDIELSGGLAAIEFTMAAAALLVSLASYTGTYRLVEASEPLPPPVGTSST